MYVYTIRTSMWEATCTYIQYVHRCGKLRSLKGGANIPEHKTLGGIHIVHHCIPLHQSSPVSCVCLCVCVCECVCVSVCVCVCVCVCVSWSIVHLYPLHIFIHV